MHQCSMCSFFCRSQDDLIGHLLRRHRNASNFIVHCCAVGCGATFKSYDTYRKHCVRKYLDNNEVDLDQPVNEDNYMFDDQDYNVESHSTEFERQMVDAQYILKLKASYNLSQSAVSDVILSTRSLFSERLDLIKQRLALELPLETIPSNVIDNIFQEHLFQDLDSEYLQEKFFKENFGFIQPEAVKLGDVYKQVKDKARFKFVKRDAIGYFVPFIKQLEKLLSMPEVQESLNEEVEISDKFSDFFDGTYMTKQFFIRHPDALLICLYFDDFEIANPIGAHRKKHKLSIFYWSLINISPAFRFKIQATQLLAVAKASYLKKFGLDNILSDFTKGMTKLHNGTNIRIDSKNKLIFGTLYCVLGDTLGAQLLGGFKEGVAFAEKPCRTCEITHVDLNESVRGDQYPARDLQEHIDRCEYLQEHNKTMRRYWSRKYGVTYRTPLLNIPEFDVTKCILHDPMHVLFEGIVKMELQLMLNEMIYKKNYFSLQGLNLAIRNFNYTEEELLDKPQEIEKKSLDSKNVLPMTAIEIKNFMILLPFMIGDQVPDDDAYWQNFIRLLQITLLVISPISSNETIDSLYQLIFEHNTNFRILYADVNLTPKLHYLTHLPEQIKLFGPGRNHWCVRFEAKHGLFKAKKWKNFKAIEKSIAIYHQRWMCLQQCGDGRKPSEVYLFSGDTVKQGIPVPKENISLCLKTSLERNNVQTPDQIMSTSQVCIKGVNYSSGKVLLLQKLDQEDPTFVKIENIYVVEHLKLFEVAHLEITDFVSHINAFECKTTNIKSVIGMKDLMYKWPQMQHFLGGRMHVMLQNVDFCWK